MVVGACLVPVCCCTIGGTSGAANGDEHECTVVRVLHGCAGDKVQGGI